MGYLASSEACKEVEKSGFWLGRLRSQLRLDGRGKRGKEGEKQIFLVM